MLLVAVASAFTHPGLNAVLLRDCALVLQFAIRIKVRHNDKLKRKEVIDRVAKLFEAPHSVDLSNPEALFVVECVRSVCGLSIVPTDRLESNTFSIKFAANDASNAAPVAAETTDSSTTAR